MPTIAHRMYFMVGGEGGGGGEVEGERGGICRQAGHVKGS